MTTIKSTIEQAIPQAARSYPQYVDQATAALQDREDKIKDALRTYAVDRGLSTGEVDGLLVEVGFDEPTPEPIAEADTLDDSDDSMPGWARALRDTVRSLSEKVDGLTR